MSEKVYCIFCEREATWWMIHGDDDESKILRGHSTPLCDACKEAYEAGQVSPTAEAFEMSGRDEWGDTEVEDE